MFRVAVTLLLLAAATASARNTKGEIVTWADFSWVHWVGVSMERVYFATTEGITRYNRLERRFEEPLTGGEGLDHSDVNRVWVDHFDQRVFASTSDDLMEYDPLFDRWYPVDQIPLEDIKTEHVDPPNLLHMPFGTFYSPEGEISDFESRVFRVTDVVDDGTGDLWMGTWGMGAAVAPASSSVLEFLPEGLLQNSILAMLWVDDWILVGGAVFDQPRTGLTWFNADTYETEFVESGLDRSFPAYDVLCLEADESMLYLGTAIGVQCFDQTGSRVRRVLDYRAGLPDDYIWSLAMVGDTLLIGTNSGLGLARPSVEPSEVMRHASFEGRPVYDLAVDGDEVWIATSHGAYRWDRVKGTLQRFKHPDIMLEHDVYDIELSDSFLWLATAGGLVRIDRETGAPETYLSLPIDRLSHALAANDEIAAIASGQGFELIHHDYKRPIMRRFTTSDGLPSDEVHCLSLDGEHLWIGSDKGLTRFWWANPSRID